MACPAEARRAKGGWEDRIRTYVTGSRIQGPAARRLPNNILI